MATTPIKEVGSLLNLQAAMGKDFLYDGMTVAQALKHLLCGDVLTCLGLLGFVQDVQPFKQHFSDLLGRGNVEG